MPDYLAGVDVERDERAGVEVVARAPLAGVARRRVAGADDVELRLRIVGTGNPGLAAAVARRVEARPRVQAGIAGVHRHGVGLPLQLAGLGIERLQEARHVEVVAGADEDVIADDHWSGGGEVLFVKARELDVPALLARPRIERHQVVVGRLEVEIVLPQAGAAVADVRAAARLPVIAPQLVPVGGVERPDVVGRGHVEHVVDLEDRALHARRAGGREFVAAFAADDHRGAAATAATAAAAPAARGGRTGRQLGHPVQAESFDGGLVDLGQRAEAPPRVITRIGRPLIGQRFQDRGGIEPALALRGQEDRHGGERSGQQKALCEIHFNVTR